MQNKKWESVYNIFQVMEKTCEPLSGILKDLSPVNGNGDITLQIHNRLVEVLNEFRNDLNSLIHPDDAKLVSIPIILYFDELILTNYFYDNPLSWPLLQERIFNAKNGGEKFYSIADLILKKENVECFIYEVYYFCLKHGFRGKLIDQESEKKEYMKMFELKIISENKSS